MTNKYQEFLEKGKQDERRFLETLTNTCGGAVISADEKTDMVDHIDLFWKYDEDKRPVSFDVKGLKKNKRTDEFYNPDIEWIEFTNVQGKPGWVNGKADYIVFETFDDWLVIKRDKLKRLVEEQVHDKTPTTNRDTWFRFYTRSNYGRQDKMVKVPTSFIRHNADRIIIKKEFLLAYSKK